MHSSFSSWKNAFITKIQLIVQFSVGIFVYAPTAACVGEVQ